MRTLFLLILFIATSMKAQTIFNFTSDGSINNWSVVDDGVMGGRSKGTMTINSEGHGLFSGQISLKNNGGFSSVRYRLPEPMNIEGATQMVLKVKGDGKNYQLRVRDDYQKRYSHIQAFETSGDWQTIYINLAEMYPSFRGRRVALPNFDALVLEEITILIGNKKAENFCLLIDAISLQ